MGGRALWLHTAGNGDLHRCNRSSVGEGREGRLYVAGRRSLQGGGSVLPARFIQKRKDIAEADSERGRSLQPRRVARLSELLRLCRPTATVALDGDSALARAAHPAPAA